MIPHYNRARLILQNRLQSLAVELHHAHFSLCSLPGIFFALGLASCGRWAASRIVYQALASGRQERRLGS
jgi:hypothetical protein